MLLRGFCYLWVLFDRYERERLLSVFLFITHTKDENIQETMLPGWAGVQWVLATLHHQASVVCVRERNPGPTTTA